MRHLWTSVTTQDTVTHDAGAPEWLDLPISDYVVESTPDLEELPLRQELDPPWLLQSRWMIDDADLGHHLIPVVELRDPLGITLYNEAQIENGFGQALSPQVFPTEPIRIDLPWEYTWYTFPGAYTFIVRWVGSPANRDTGCFSLIMSEPNGGGNDE